MTDYKALSDSELIDLVEKKILDQGCASYRQNPINNGCLYRLETLGGVLKCAAGHLIPDEMYTSEMEGKNFFSTQTRENVVELYPEVGAMFRNEQFFLISKLQEAHDCAAEEEVKGECNFVDAFKARVAYVRNDLVKRQEAAVND